MIIKLDNSDRAVAQQIFAVFQRSYKIEAELIGTLDFPPLTRSAQDIQHSKTAFYGFTEQQNLGAVIEIVIEDKHLEIHSLTVDPKYFRRGIADRLINYILAEIEFTEAIVETAEVNIPAINLYNKHGFTEFKKWTPSHGIPKVAMVLEPASNTILHK
ncbi:N-acetyltransferase [uncultured Paraglaciecola sp.]|mgnify:CR=1 FL=1|uniref:GNAT family N-acetyltransferase n=1 Tax=uncultured Paraglaciecola sp. TaxID=1765024 RepID=UPI00261ECAF3|nr:N-acetyltransferase [uncultured Paraglaciecola sp.]